MESAVLAVKTYRRLSRALEEQTPSVAARFRRNPAIYLAEIVSAIQFGKAFRELLTIWAPSCVVSTSDMWPFEYQLAYQSKQLGIPSSVIQHGIVGYFWYPFVADLYLTWGEMFAEQMIAYGAPRERLAMCGMPASDTLFRGGGSADAERHRRGNKSPVCLILSHAHTRTTEPQLFQRFSDLVTKTVLSAPHVRWRVKLHPSEDSSFYQQMGSTVYRHLEVLPKTISLEKAVGESDVILTLFSTAGLEAMILRRPVLVADVGEKVREFAWWPQFGGGLYVKSPGELLEAIDGLARDDLGRIAQLDLQRRFLERSFANRGRAAMAAVDEIESRSRPTTLSFDPILAESISASG
jgi:hypothetical protein